MKLVSHPKTKGKLIDRYLLLINNTVKNVYHISLNVYEYLIHYKFPLPLYVTLLRLNVYEYFLITLHWLYLY